MLRKSRIFSISVASFALLMGLLMLFALLPAFFDADAGAILIATDALLLLCGLFGLAGGLLLRARLKLARTLLLIAALLGIPLGLVFFFVFMYARKGTLRPREDDAFRPTNIGAAP